MNIDGSNLNRLTHNLTGAEDVEPAWSSDGTRIVFSAIRDNDWTHLYTMTADGINRVRLTSGEANDHSPAWSPDGSKIAFKRSHDRLGTDGDIYLMNPDGTNVVRLTMNGTSDQFAALSPNGRGRIVFDSNENNASSDPINLVDLFLMRSDGSNRQYLVRGSSASWSPDSQRIAFQRSASGTGIPINPQPGAPAEG